MKRSAIRRSTPEKIRAWAQRSRRLRPRSAKQAAAYVERRAFVADFLAANPWCEAEFPECWRRATTVNELIRRSHLGAIVPGPKATVQGQQFHALCEPCHDFLTTHPTFARREGWEVQ